MKPPKETLQASVTRQREELAGMVAESLARAAQACSEVWGDRARLDAALAGALSAMPYCKFLYALDTNAVQISDNVSREGYIQKDFGRDRSQRPYVSEIVPAQDFVLSEAYISLRARRPSLTAIQIVRDAEHRVLGFVGADFDLRDLPLTRELYEEPRYWQQIKGDPSIRGTVFHQTRVESEMDRRVDDVLGLIEELVIDHGLFHVMLHFSSSRAVIWLYDDPYRYRLLDSAALTDPDTCLAYPRRLYPNDAAVPADRVRAVLDGFRQLRFMDEMLYLRSGTLNIFNGVVGLTFSCDGSHYIPYDEFLDKDHAFWVGGIAGS
ncbi:MAG: PDC sensor domain-containing protein [Pseudomonadota bacterium]|nr:MAG: PDC sensor domain-containing protein [Pseudomonadota bacterium]